MLRSCGRAQNPARPRRSTEQASAPRGVNTAPNRIALPAAFGAAARRAQPTRATPRALRRARSVTARAARRAFKRPSHAGVLHSVCPLTSFCWARAKGRRTVSRRPRRLPPALLVHAVSFEETASPVYGSVLGPHKRRHRPSFGPFIGWRGSRRGGCPTNPPSAPPERAQPRAPCASRPRWPQAARAGGPCGCVAPPALPEGLGGLFGLI
jgi:hypothetical protein